MTGKELENEYRAIWKKYQNTALNAPTPSSTDKLLDRGFVFQFDEEIENPDVLFVGINPSYKHNSIKEEKYYTKEQSLKHSYFQPFKNIAEELNDNYQRSITWTHMDMLVFRETKQAFIKDHLFRLPDLGYAFIVEQLNIAKRILEYIQPKVMVVSNTMARELMGKNRGLTEGGQAYGVWMGLEFEFDKSIGTDVIVNHETLGNTKVFFTSMLSGQRALDNGTRERLVWHINEVLK